MRRENASLGKAPDTPTERRFGSALDAGARRPGDRQDPESPWLSASMLSMFGRSLGQAAPSKALSPCTTDARAFNPSSLRTQAPTSKRCSRAHARQLLR